MAVIAAGVLVLIGCGNATEPAALPRTGRYAYTMAVPGSLAGVSLRTFTGTLVISSITRDSLAGAWDVPSSSYGGSTPSPGYQTRLTLGQPTGGGWYFFAYPTDGWTIQHRLFPGTSPRCEGAALYLNGSGGITRREGACTVRYQGP